MLHIPIYLDVALRRVADGAKALLPHWLYVGNTLGVVGMICTLLYFWFFEPSWLVYRNSPLPVLNSTGYGTLPQIHRGVTIRLYVARGIAELWKCA